MERWRVIVDSRMRVGVESRRSSPLLTLEEGGACRWVQAARELPENGMEEVYFDF